MSRETEVREVTGRLEALLDTLKGNVAALNAILAPEGAPPDGAGTFPVPPPPEEVPR